MVAAALLKLYPAALLPWFVWKARRERRAFLIPALAGGAVLLVTLPVWPSFLEAGMHVVRQNALHRTSNYSLTAILARLLHPAAEHGSASAALPWLVASAVGAALLLGSYLLCRLRSLPDERCICLLLTATVAVSLTVWPHYLVLVVPAFAFLTLWVLDDPGWVRLAGYGAF